MRNRGEVGHDVSLGRYEPGQRESEQTARRGKNNFERQTEESQRNDDSCELYRKKTDDRSEQENAMKIPRHQRQHA